MRAFISPERLQELKVVSIVIADYMSNEVQQHNNTCQDEKPKSFIGQGVFSVALSEDVTGKCCVSFRYFI